MRNIAKWVFSDQNFDEGVELYRQHFGENIVYRMFKNSGDTSYNRIKLADALDEIVVKDLPKRAASERYLDLLKSIQQLEFEKEYFNHSVVQAPPTPESSEIEDLAETVNDLQHEVNDLSSVVSDLEVLPGKINGLEEKLDQAIQNFKPGKTYPPEAKIRFNERSHLHAQLRVEQPDNVRLEKCLRILDIRKELNVILDPPAPTPAPPPITDRAAMVKRRDNLRSNISKNKNNPKKAAKVAAWIKEKESLEAIINTPNAND